MGGCEFKGRGDVSIRCRGALADQLNELQAEEGEVERRVCVQYLVQVSFQVSDQGKDQDNIIRNVAHIED